MRRFFVLLGLLLVCVSAHGATFLVDDLGDGGDAAPGDTFCATADAIPVCTLRAAIEEANAFGGSDIIEFSLTGSINPATNLVITSEIHIEGSTAPGYDGTTPLVEIDGGGTTAIGLHFSAGSANSSVDALLITDFTPTAGIQAEETVTITRCTIASNGEGIAVLGSDTIITGNQILLNEANGVAVTGATGVRIGSTTPGEGNVISGNVEMGVMIDGGDNAVILGNMIGTDDTGAAELANEEGGILVTDSDGVTVGDGTAAGRNLISGNANAGVAVGDGDNNIISGNYIGVDVAGTSAIGNDTGVLVGPGTGNVISGNLISGNVFEGIVLEGDDVTIRGNIIGLDVTGDVGIGNGLEGIFGETPVANITIGGLLPGQGNVISFNGSSGIDLPLTSSFIYGNTIGLNAAGDDTRGNAGPGIALIDPSSVTIGDPAGMNVISGNSFAGIILGDGSDNIIQNNRIGTTSDGLTGQPNLDTGVLIMGSTNTIIRSNIVSANGFHGIEMTFDPVGTVVESNLVGVNAVGAPLGNTFDGVNVCDGAEDTVVGGAGAGNVIANNGGNGIGVEPTALLNNQFLENSIFDNTDLGIDLGIDGVTLNDPNDADPLTPEDAAPNGLQNFPVIDVAVSSGTASTIQGTINSTPSTALTLHFYASSAPDPSNHGEGQTYLGSTPVMTDGSGNASFSFNGPALATGNVVAATATSADGTSEFSEVQSVGDAPVIEFSAATYMTGEGAVIASIGVTRTGNLDVTSTVQYATSNGTATFGFDYAATSGTITFDPGEAADSFNIPVTDDALDEVDETINLTLSNPTAAALGSQSTAVLTLTDDDPTPTISIGDVSMNEGNAGTTDFVFTISLSAASGQNVQVDFATAAGSATAGSDYTHITGQATILAGDVSTIVTVQVSGDVVFEADETFLVDLTNAVNATIADNQAQGTIQNDEGALTLTINDVTQAEGNAGTTNFVFTVTMSGVSGSNVTVNYQTADGTATAGSDYTAATDVATILAGDTTTTITVAVSGDAATEADETFFVNLSGSVGATIADNQGVGTITNDDAALTLSINDVAQAEGNAGTTNFVFTVTMSGVSGSNVTVNYQTADDTAAAGSDYAAAAGPATILAGDTTTTITVVVNGDAGFEPDETFFVNLSGAVGATIADGQGLGTITNDDAGLDADLSIIKTIPHPQWAQNFVIPFTIQVTNNGPAPATVVTVTDTLPAELTFESADMPGGICSGTTTVTCTLPTLASGASATITLRARTVATGIPSTLVTNTATVSAATGDSNPGNNSGSVTFTLISMIPTLSTWVLIALAAALAVIAMKRLI
jgi:parallel beta-helix repeat protein